MDHPGRALERAPCGYLALRDDSTLLAVNETLLDMLGHQPRSGACDGR